MISTSSLQSNRLGQASPTWTYGDVQNDYSSPYRPDVGDAGTVYDPDRLYGAQPGGGTRIGQFQHDNPATDANLADSGYVWDEAERRYVPRYSSTKSKNQTFDSMSALFGANGSGGAAGPKIEYGGPALTAAQDEAFARAKDRAGSLARSAATSVRENAASRGVLGAGFETENIAKQAIAPSMNVLGDLNARQMAEAYNAATHGADMSYRGAIEQRGQDQQTKLASMTALMSALRGFA